MNDLLWFAQHFLKVFSQIPLYLFCLYLLSLQLIVAWCKILVVERNPFIGNLLERGNCIIFVALWPLVVVFLCSNHLFLILCLTCKNKIHCVFVENFYKLMIWWKLFTNSVDEYSPIIGFYGLALRWVEPNNANFSFLFVLIVFF